MFFNHVVPNAKADEIRGPFALAAYLRARPGLRRCRCSCSPRSTSFAIGLRRRRPILVFVLPVAMFCGFFLWDWSPTWLAPRLEQAPDGARSRGVPLAQRDALKLDRGVDSTTRRRSPSTPSFWVSRVGVLGHRPPRRGRSRERHFARTLRGQLRGDGQADAAARRRPRAAAEARRRGRRVPSRAAARPRDAQPAPSGSGAGTLEVARVELRELRSSPGLYLFIPLILLQTLGAQPRGAGALRDASSWPRPGRSPCA